MLKNIKIWLIIAAAAAVGMLVCSFGNNNGLLAYIEALSHAHASDNSGGENVLKAGVRADITNFSTYNSETGKYCGLEVDIARELAARMGYDGVSFSTVEPVRRVTALESGEVDVIIGLYSVSEERSKLVDFSPVYYTDTVQIVVENTSGFESLNDLSGTQAAVLNGSSALDELEKLLKSEGLLDEGYTPETFMAINTMDNYKAMFDALELGSIDTVIADGAIASRYMDDGRTVIYKYPGTSYAAATKKDSELSGDVAAVMQEMLDDGTIDEIKNKWSF